MPIVTAQRKKQRTLIGIVGLIILVSVGVLFLGRRGDKKPEGQIFEPEIPIDLLIIPKEVRLDLGILDDPRFKNLIPYEKVRIDIDMGRSNPFSPYTLESTEIPNNSGEL
jgi:hypothetical protein